MKLYFLLLCLFIHTVFADQVINCTLYNTVDTCINAPSCLYCYNTSRCLNYDPCGFPMTRCSNYTLGSLVECPYSWIYNLTDFVLVWGMMVGLYVMMGIWWYQIVKDDDKILTVCLWVFGGSIFALSVAAFSLSMSMSMKAYTCMSCYYAYIALLSSICCISLIAIVVFVYGLITDKIRFCGFRMYTQIDGSLESEQL